MKRFMPMPIVTSGRIPIDPDFAPFSPLFFTTSQGDGKHGWAQAFLEAQAPTHSGAEAYDFALPAIDSRQISAQAWVAWWTTLTHRLRMQGIGILPRLIAQGLLQDEASQSLLHLLFSTPPTQMLFRRQAHHILQALQTAEARRCHRIAQSALAVFWRDSTNETLPAEESTPAMLPPWPDDLDTDAALAFLGSLALRRQHGETLGIVVETLLDNATRHGFTACWLTTALHTASQTWRDEDAVTVDLRLQAKTRQAELGRRLASLSAALQLWLDDDTNPDHILQRMNAYWPEPFFSDYRAAQDFVIAWRDGANVCAPPA